MPNISPQKVAIVTGAGSGIGRATAQLLAEAGYAVALVARTQAALQETADSIANRAGSTTTDATTATTATDPAPTLIIPADVAQPRDVQRIVDATLKRFGRIDAVANVAGTAPLQPIEQITDAVLDDCLAVNLKAVVTMTRAVWPTFKQQNAGAIVNVSSMASVDPFPGLNIYAAAKAGVNLFTKATADEGAPHHITAHAVAPGAVETPMLRGLFSADDLPEANTLPPAAVARVICDLLTGKHTAQPGETILIPSPS